ncbi:MAG TPA: LppP/LprE family lipoprotein [Acidimicrobiales bacterium]|nr:LppP/LprE family lipoprotein [Acidimicrobiales bacterium]
MRTPSRSHNSRLALAALGVLAALVALTGSASGTAGAGPAAPAPVDDAVRDVDFASLAQPGTTCAEGLRITPPRRIEVDEGESGLLDLGRLTRLEVDGDVTYGDVDGDGAEEAVVHTVCAYGANGAQDSVQVWSVEDDEPVLVDTLGEPSTRVTGPLPPALVDTSVDDGQLVVRWTRYGDDDPNCCPSGQTTLRYELDDGALDQVGRAVNTDTAS